VAGAAWLEVGITSLRDLVPVRYIEMSRIEMSRRRKVTQQRLSATSKSFRLSGIRSFDNSFDVAGIAVQRKRKGLSRSPDISDERASLFLRRRSLGQRGVIFLSSGSV
jgi:hypothetical protein